jgi:hypothetical protein
MSAITRSAIAEQVVASSTADREALERMAAAWRAWAATDTAWFAVLHGELVCRVPEADGGRRITGQAQSAHGRQRAPACGGRTVEQDPTE